MKTTLEQRQAIAKLMGWEHIPHTDLAGKNRFMWGWFDGNDNRVATFYTEDLEPMIDGDDPFPSDAEAMQALDAWVREAEDRKRTSSIYHSEYEGQLQFECEADFDVSNMGQCTTLYSGHHHTRRDAIVEALLQAMGVDDDSKED